MVEGAQKRKTLRLMTIIIVMFLLCHLPKVDPILGVLRALQIACETW